MSHITLFARFVRAAPALAWGRPFASPAGPAIARAPAKSATPATPPPAAPAAPTTPRQVIQHIIVNGTQRIEPSTVLSYISMREGDVYNDQTTDVALKTLYQTGLF